MKEHEESIVGRVYSTCGDTSDSIQSLYDSNNQKWANYEDKEIMDYLVLGSTVPVIFTTPASHNGKLDDVYFHLQ